ncbi:MAG: hypothetical protein RI967_2556 [Planctomycetota bacterium]|jgi:hypothetical protein
MKNWLATALMGATAATASAESSGYARFAQTTDTIRVLGNTTFDQGDFTYEARIRLAPNAPLGSIIWEQRTGTEDKNLQLASDGSYLASGCFDSPKGNIRGSLPPTDTTTWVHVAIVHSGPTVHIYIDGLRVETRVVDGCYVDDPSSVMSIGLFRQQGGVDRPSFLGDLDWIRVSRGARYVGDFAPPFECELDADSDTQLLLRFNEPAGTKVLIDESPNRFECQIGVHVAAGGVATSPTLGNSVDGFPSCPCPADVDENSLVDGVDLAIVLSRWGTLPTDYPRADTNGDGTVDGSDLATLLSGWGACP